MLNEMWRRLIDWMGLGTRPTVFLDGTEPRELASLRLPSGRSRWYAALGGGSPRRDGDWDQEWALSLTATYERRGRDIRTVDVRHLDGDEPIVHLWLEPRDGRVRVMAQGTGRRLAVQLFDLRIERGEVANA